MTGEDIRTLLSVVAIVVSLVSVYFARCSWLQSNRPIVSAFLSAHPGNMATAFDLILANTGTRPAVDVKLHAKDVYLQSICRNCSAADLPGVATCFAPNALVPLLRNGEELTTSFGLLRPDGPEPSLVHNARIPIRVSYSDLDGRRYESRVPLMVRLREGFGGGSWQRAP